MSNPAGATHKHEGFGVYFRKIDDETWLSYSHGKWIDASKRMLIYAIPYSKKLT